MPKLVKAGRAHQVCHEVRQLSRSLAVKNSANIICVPPQPRRYVPLRELNWRWVLLIFGVAFICRFFYKYLDFVANQQARSPLEPLIWESTGTVSAILLFPFCYWIAIRFPLVSRSWWRYLPVHLATVCVYSFVHTTMMAVERNPLYRLFGLGKYDYGYMPVRYVMEFSNDFATYWLFLGLVYLFHEILFSRDREVRQARLEASLAATQLENLRLQLEPHFLFNALNTISATLYEDSRKADEMIGRLSELLRETLESDRSQEVSLAREVELLNLYIRIMEARLEHRLAVRIDIEERLRQALVPQLLLQPLVENAIRHGMDPQTFRVHVSVSAKQENGRVHIQVRDHGPGIEETEVRRGIGLRNTAERVARLYGNDHQLVIHNAADGGALIEIELPLRISPTAHATAAAHALA